MIDRGEWEARQRKVVAELEQRARSVRAALERIRIRTPSRNGELGVTVDAQGHVLDIRLTPQALRLGEVGLARALVWGSPEVVDIRDSGTDGPWKDVPHASSASIVFT